MSHNSPLFKRVGYRLALESSPVKPEEETSARSEAGTMIDSRAGVMATDRAMELRAQRIGEVVDHAERLLERRFSSSQNDRWQALWRQSMGAQSNSAPPLTDEETNELADLNAAELWSRAVAAEQKARVATLRAMTDEAAIMQFNARGRWPE